MGKAEKSLHRDANQLQLPFSAPSALLRASACHHVARGALLATKLRREPHLWARILTLTVSSGGRSLTGRSGMVATVTICPRNT